MTKIKNKFIFIGITIFCVLALLFTYFVEHVLKHAPCNLCLIERIPYMTTIIIASSVLLFSKYEKIALHAIGLIFAIGMIVSFYHFGIEQGFFKESLVCDLVEGNSAESIKDLLRELNTKNISCKDITFRIFGFSLATFNTIISLVISVIILRTGLNYDKN